MFVYNTPDDRSWLYGGAQPVGISDDFAARLTERRHGLPNLGELSWEEHSSLWAGVFTGTVVDDTIDAIVETIKKANPNQTLITSENVAKALMSLLTHPG